MKREKSSLTALFLPPPNRIGNEKIMAKKTLKCFSSPLAFPRVRA